MSSTRRSGVRVFEVLCAQVLTALGFDRFSVVRLLVGHEGLVDFEGLFAIP